MGLTGGISEDRFAGIDSTRGRPHLSTINRPGWGCSLPKPPAGPGKEGSSEPNVAGVTVLLRALPETWRRPQVQAANNVVGPLMRDAEENGRVAFTLVRGARGLRDGKGPRATLIGQPENKVWPWAARSR